MIYRTLGKSGIQVSIVSFGAGPVSGLMVGSDYHAQCQTVQRALDAGIKWFDTAATYGNGDSETSLGAALQACHAPQEFHVATKVRLLPEQLNDIAGAVRLSFQESLRRLHVDRVTLLQLHNSVTRKRGDLPTSLTVQDVLGPGGVTRAFEALRIEGLVDHFGFTGLGDMQSLSELVRTGVFTSAQIPLSVLTPGSGADRSAGSVDVDYELVVDECASRGIATIAIRVFAGGALSGQGPSPHTFRTKFFTLDLFERDRLRARELEKLLPPENSLADTTVRYVLGRSGVATALIGFSNPRQIDTAIQSAEHGDLDEPTLRQVRTIRSGMH